MIETINTTKVQYSITEADANQGEVAEVSVYLEDKGSIESVTVYGPRKKFGKICGPEINWSSLGSCSASDSQAYAELILFCSKLSATLAGPTS